MGGATWSAVLATIIGIVLTALVALIAYTFTSFARSVKEDMKEIKEDIREARKELTKDIDQNTRHLNGIMGLLSPAVWRIHAVEDFLTEHLGYKPPREVGDIERDRWK